MKAGNDQGVLWRIFFVVYGIAMILILGLSILETENHLPASKMIILPVIMFVTLYLFGLFLKRTETFLCEKSKFLLPVFLVSYGLLIYGIGLSGRCEPVHDQAAVYQGGLYFAGLSEEISWSYFARCNNNIMPAVILGFIFRIGALGGLVDPYYFAVFVNVLQVLVAMYCMFRLSKERNGIVSAWLTVIMLGLFVPIIGHSKSLYTDGMSFCFGIVAFYLFFKNGKEKNKIRYALNIVLCGLVIGIGAATKMTVLITIIAILVFSLFEKNKKLFLNTCIAFGIALSVIVLCNHYTTTLPCEELRDSYGAPSVSYFMGIGMKGNGGYIDNQEYSIHLNTIYGMEEKEAWTRQYIKENAYEFLNRDHILQKLRYNFANGLLGCDIFVHTLEKDNLLYRLMHYEGDYYWRYSMIMTAYMYTCYIWIIVNAAIMVFKKQKVDSMRGVSLIALFGIMLYLMLFEAHNRQMYNHLTWLVLAASSGLAEFLKRPLTLRKI